MKTGKRKSLSNFLRLLPVFIATAIVLWFFITFIRGIMMCTTTELIELNTTEKVNYITDVFQIKDTNNIGSYKVFFNEGCMTVMMDEVKDIHELCFENLAYYELTEEDYSEIVRVEEKYNEIVNTPLDERDPDHYKVPESKFDGRWVSSRISSSYNYWEIRFRDKSDSYSIFVRKVDNSLCCEIRTGWGELEDLRKLRSMN